jgi:ribonucleotide monophosphatase NagD (HAD superfamily)
MTDVFVPPYDPETSGITGFLIDLDGTMYLESGLIPGAVRFFEWMKDTGKQFVFLSNTGAKGSDGVVQKFASEKYKLCDGVLALKHVYTAAEAQMALMVHPVQGIPWGAKVFVVAGGSFWLEMLLRKDSPVVRSWDVRTSLSDGEAKEWARIAKQGKESGTCPVFVVLFVDGQIGDDAHHASSGCTNYHSDWNFELVKKCSFLLVHGAKMIYTADDSFNPSFDPDHPGMMFPMPGPGMFARMLRYAMPPSAEDSFACAGKGGSHGAEFMMGRAIEMLKTQGHSGDLSTIAMVGDRFDTDMKAAASVGVRGILVESGVNMAHQQQFFPDCPATWVAESVDYLHTGEGDRAKVRRRSRPSFLSTKV